jgi:hypothetical protein
MLKTVYPLNEQPTVRFLVFIFAGLLFVGAPVDDRRTVFTLANLPTKPLPLLARAPEGGAVSLALRLRPKH